MGRPLKYESAEQLQALIDDYFNWCKSQDKISYDNKGNMRVIQKTPSIAGLCLHLDISKETFCEWRDNTDKPFSEPIKNAKLRCEEWLIDNATNGQANPIFSIFNLKNNYGYSDKQEVEHTLNSSNISDDDLDKLIEAKLQKPSNPALIEGKTTIQE